MVQRRRPSLRRAEERLRGSVRAVTDTRRWRPVCAAVLALAIPIGATAESGSTPIYGYRVVNVYPHDRDAFTQGLVYDGGVLYEGTGLYGRSTLRRVELETGRVLERRRLPRHVFGEGITVFGDRIIQLSWRSQIVLLYDKRTLQLLSQTPYAGEGWGLTHDGTQLIISDGSANLRFLDPRTLAVVRRIEVRDERGPVASLNELEHVRGEIYANVWQTDRVAVISPQTGRVRAWIDLGGLLSADDAPVDVLNGIAYDKERDRLFVTGKLWPKLFEIQVVPESR